MRRLNVRRGLFRLWLVATSIYLTVIILSAASQIDRVLSAPPAWGANEPIIAPPPAGFIVDAHPLARSIGEIIGRMGMLALLPPVLVFALGLALLWISAGFAEKRDQDYDRR
jgi:hypothetical protein